MTTTSMASAFHYLDPRGGYVNDPAWMVFDSLHLKALRQGRRRAGRTAAGLVQPVRRPRRVGRKTGIDRWSRGDGRWNDNVAHEVDPDFGRVRASDGYWVTPRRRRRRERRWAFHRHHAVLRRADLRSARWAPRVARAPTTAGTACQRQPIPGLYAAGNAMAGVTGRAYGGAAGPSARRWCSVTRPGIWLRPVSRSSSNVDTALRAKMPVRSSLSAPSQHAGSQRAGITPP